MEIIYYILVASICLFACLLAAVILLSYAKEKINMLLLILFWMGISASFSTIGLLALDITLNLQEPGNEVSDTYKTHFVIGWTSLYWFTFVLCRLIFPVVDLFVASGHFSIKNRIVDSLKGNSKFYAIILIISAIAIVAYSIYEEFSIHFIIAFVIALQNTIGFIEISFLLSFGSVHLLKTLFQQRSLKNDLQYRYASVTPCYDQFMTSTFKLEEVLKTLLEAARKIRIGHAEYSTIGILLQRCKNDVCIKYAIQTGSLTRMKNSSFDRSNDFAFTPDEIFEQNLTHADLIYLNIELKKRLRHFYRAEKEWNHLESKISFLEEQYSSLSSASESILGRVNFQIYEISESRLSHHEDTSQNCDQVSFLRENAISRIFLRCSLFHFFRQVKTKKFFAPLFRRLFFLTLVSLSSIFVLSTIVSESSLVTRNGRFSAFSWLLHFSSGAPLQKCVPKYSTTDNSNVLYDNSVVVPPLSSYGKNLANIHMHSFACTIYDSSTNFSIFVDSEKNLYGVVLKEISKVCMLASS
ncbi:putative LMBR1 domain-containing protein 2-like protein, partial [Cardiosporidium cionae]